MWTHFFLSFPECYQYFVFFCFVLSLSFFTSFFFNCWRIELCFAHWRIQCFKCFDWTTWIVRFSMSEMHIAHNDYDDVFDCVASDYIYIGAGQSDYKFAKIFVFMRMMFHFVFEEFFFPTRWIELDKQIKFVRLISSNWFVYGFVCDEIFGAPSVDIRMEQGDSYYNSLSRK